jgi:hypothetical protein
MSILTILLSLALFGFILWLITSFIPMPDPIKRIIIAIAVLFLILWLLEGMGALGPLSRPLRFGH